MSTYRPTALVSTFFIIALPLAAQDDALSWGNWRGPDANGIATGGNPPTQWSEENNIRWKVPIPGLGSSSPVVWGDRVYVTTAIGLEATPTDAAQRPTEFARYGTTAAPTNMHEFVVVALDREDGSIVWSTQVARTVPHEGGHRTATQASNSPITDGERIYASFGSRGLYCLDMDGEVQWSKNFGEMRTFREFGEGTSPVLHGDKLVLNWDHEDDSFIAAFDKRTGEELWRTPRDEGTSWSTPVIGAVGEGHQIVITATTASRGYDLETGELLWTLSGMSTTAIPSPTITDGIAYLMSGFRSSNIQVVRLAGARGDLADSDSIVWDYQRPNTSYVPSALIYGGFIYFVRLNSGILNCLDARTGATYYEGQRMNMRQVYSSPVGVAGRIYVTSRTGETKVVRVGSEYEEIATNRLDDGFDASAAIVGDEIFLRGRENLYCIAETR